MAAINGKNKSEAIKYVDSRTIKYFSNLLNYVKTADSIKVNSLSILDKLMILTFLQKSTKAEIKALDGRGLVLYAIANGLISESKLGNPSIGAVKIENNFAKGELIVNEKKALFFLSFLQGRRYVEN